MAGGIGTVAGGDINPRRFVKRGATAGFVLQAGANEQIYGVSQPGTRAVSIPGYTAVTLAAAANEGLRVFQPGDTCEIQSGAAFAIGARLKADATGRAVAVAAADGEQYGAIAEAAATAADQFVPVRVEIGVTAVA